MENFIIPNSVRCSLRELAPGKTFSNINTIGEIAKSNGLRFALEEEAKSMIILYTPTGMETIYIPIIGEETIAIGRDSEGPWVNKKSVDVVIAMQESVDFIFMKNE